MAMDNAAFTIDDETHYDSSPKLFTTAPRHYFSDAPSFGAHGRRRLSAPVAFPPGRVIHGENVNIIEDESSLKWTASRDSDNVQIGGLIVKSRDSKKPVESNANGCESNVGGIDLSIVNGLGSKVNGSDSSITTNVRISANPDNDHLCDKPTDYIEEIKNDKKKFASNTLLSPPRIPVLSHRVSAQKTLQLSADLNTGSQSADLENYTENETKVSGTDAHSCSPIATGQDTERPNVGNGVEVRKEENGVRGIPGQDVGEGNDDANRSDGIPNNTAPRTSIDHTALDDLQLLTVPGPARLTLDIPGDSAQDGAVVVSIPVPVLPRARSAPDLTTPELTGEKETAKSEGVDTDKDGVTGKEKVLKEMTREEILKTYRLHFFVCLIFLVTLISVSLAWYYKNMATEHIYATQAIFFDPRSRELTLTDPNNGHKIHAKLGQDMPDWQLPLHCPIVMGDNPHVKECVWKNHAILRIVHFRDTYVQCYNVSWESLHAEHVPYDCFNIQDGVWYGPSNQSQSMYPIRGEFQLVPKDYTVRNNGIFSSVVDFYWLSSTGVGLYLQPDNPLQIVWGSSGLCVLSNFTGPFYHQENSQTPPYLNYTLCNGVDPVQTNAYMQKMLVPREGIKRPDDKYFLGPYWSLRKAAQDDDTGSQIEDLAGKLVDFGFQDSKIILDGSWEKHFGDLKFNPEKFQNFSDQVDTLKQSGFDVVVPISPYFELTSDNFYDGVTQSMFVLDAGGQVPGLTNFEGGIAAILDVLNAKAVTWMENKTKTLSDTLRQKNFRLTYGSKAWLPYKPHFSQPSGTPNMFRKAMTEMFHDHDYPQSLLIVEHTSSSRHVPALIPVLTDVGVVDGRNCLVGAIETALTLGLMGYPFLLLEGVVEKPETRLSEELFLRWLQLAAVFPAHQYTAVPWNYGNDIINMATNVTSLHEQLVMAEMNKKYLMEEVGSGLPILRPIWWLDPSNETLHKLEIKDQFLIGNELLVAPVLCEGVQTRDVYFPPGNWLDPNGILSVGPKILLNQTVPRDTLLFYRKAMVTQ
ncbi:unnamed protein product [Lymnaea stagnalis]|uniref:Uncharacterized protein n=1 Tax=Lymnaea stagnalis TaxID=6523 RepID=A0AAV2H590_LYMST